MKTLYSICLIICAVSVVLGAASLIAQWWLRDPTPWSAAIWPLTLLMELIAIDGLWRRRLAQVEARLELLERTQVLIGKHFAPMQTIQGLRENAQNSQNPHR